MTSTRCRCTFAMPLGSIALLASLAATTPATAGLRPAAEAARQELAAVHGDVEVHAHPATGAARFVRLPTGANASVVASAPKGQTATAAVAEASFAFLERHAALFGLRDARRELRAGAAVADRQGGTHVTLRQVQGEVPVFGADLRLHYDRRGRLAAVNGTVVPDLAVPTTPTLARAEAAAAALAAAAARLGVDAAELRASGVELVVHHAGLARGVAAVPRLAWKVEVVGARGGLRAGVGPAAQAVRDWWMVDAHAGDAFDRLPGIHTALRREVYHRELASEALIWKEGDGLPFTALPPDDDQAVNRLLRATGDTYDLFFNLTSGSLQSYDGDSATMKSVHDDARLDGACPNAFWNGESASFCPNTAVDDIVGHEWTHAYTEHSHGLIYLWQQGALNESYSDIFGEVVDLLDGGGTDEPNLPRLPGRCSDREHATLPQLRVVAPAAARETLPVGSFRYLPSLIGKPVSGQLVLVNNPPQPGVRNAPPVVHNACMPLLQPAAVKGRIALVEVDPGCPVEQRLVNLQQAGAIAVVFAFDDDRLARFGDRAPSAKIPGVVLRAKDVARLRPLLGGLRVRLSHQAGTDPSPRWLIGEDDAGPGYPFRDMWNPACVGQASVVDDDRYYCREADGGGVHLNSSVPNRVFATLVDGGRVGNATVPALGLTKAAHVYWRAALLYQGPYTDFDEHALALGEACGDLAAAATNLPRLTDGTPSGEVLTAGDCAAVAKALAAARFERRPCGFEPLLRPTAPPLCAQGAPQTFSSSDFEQGLDGWTVQRRADRPQDPGGTWRPDPWRLADDLPQERPGDAALATYPTACPGGPPGPAGWLTSLTSPEMTIPASGEPRLAFDHWVAVSERLRSAAVLQVSVDGGPFEELPLRAFVFNAPNTLLTDRGFPFGVDGYGWVGQDGGSPGGSWGQTQVDLAGVATPGQRVRVRFALTSRLCSQRTPFEELVRWYVDDVRAFTCAPAAP